MTEYELLEGTEPSDIAPHEPRTIRRTNDDGSVYMIDGTSPSPTIRASEW